MLRVENSSQGIATQNFQIIQHLKKGGKVTCLSALRFFGVMRLSARIWDLRESGHDIVSDWIKLDNGKRIKEYRLVKNQLEMSG